MAVSVTESFWHEPTAPLSWVCESQWEFTTARKQPLFNDMLSGLFIETNYGWSAHKNRGKCLTLPSRYVLSKQVTSFYLHREHAAMQTWYENTHYCIKAIWKGRRDISPQMTACTIYKYRWVVGNVSAMTDIQTFTVVSPDEGTPLLRTVNRRSHVAWRKPSPSQQKHWRQTPDRTASRTTHRPTADQSSTSAMPQNHSNTHARAVCLCAGA